MSLFIDNPRDYALELVYSDAVDRETLLIACLKYMSHDEVRGMLEANELSPSFFAEQNDD
jgi:hypothetical protein